MTTPPTDHHEHPHPHPHPKQRDPQGVPFAYDQLMTEAIGNLRTERDVISADGRRRATELLDAKSPAEGARVVAARAGHCRPAARRGLYRQARA